MRCKKGTISMQAVINHEVPFNVPPCVGDEVGYVQEAIESNRKICGDGPFTKNLTVNQYRDYLASSSCGNSRRP